MDAIQSFLASLPPVVAYLALLLSTIIENLFPPFPGDTVTLVGAYLVGTHTLNFWMTYFVTTLGSLIGFYFLYLVGRVFGRNYFYRKNFRYFSRKSIQQVESLFERRGILIIAVNRFLSGLRAVISLVAGIASYDWRVVLGLGFVSCILWNGALIYAGSAVGENRELVVAWLKRFNIAVFLIVGIGVLLWGYFNLYLPAKSAWNTSNTNSTKED